MVLSVHIRFIPALVSFEYILTHMHVLTRSGELCVINECAGHIGYLVELTIDPSDLHLDRSTPQHPKQTPNAATWQQSLEETLARSVTKVKWMLVTLIVPEFLVGRAFQDWIMAKKSFSQMKGFAEKDNVEWTLTHAY